MIAIREFKEPIKHVPASSVVRLGNRIIRYHGLKSRAFGTTVVQRAEVSNDEGHWFDVAPDFPVHFISSITEYDALAHRT